METTAAPRRARTRVAASMLATAVALGLVGAGGDASAAPANSVAENRANVADKRADRQVAEARLDAAEAALAAVHDKIGGHSVEREAIASQIADARRLATQRAVDVYVNGHGARALVAMLQSDDMQDAAARTSYLSGQARSAMDAAVDLQLLQDRNEPELVALASELDAAVSLVEQARNDLIQASAHEADAERALTQALDRSREADARTPSNRPAAPASPTPTVPPAPTSTEPPAAPVAVVPVVPEPPQPQSVFGPMAPKFEKLRQCESSGNYHIVSASGRYRGAYQFDQRTWESVGGVGDPAAASPAEQDLRAWILYQARGWRPWPHCGVHLR